MICVQHLKDTVATMRYFMDRKGPALQLDELLLQIANTYMRMTQASSGCCVAGAVGEQDLAGRGPGR